MTVYLAQMDARTAAGSLMTEADAELYLAWSNALGRTLVRLGLQGADKPKPTLRDHMASRQGPTT